MIIGAFDRIRPLLLKGSLEVAELIERRRNVLETWIDKHLCSIFDEIGVQILNLLDINHPGVICDGVEPGHVVAFCEKMIVIAT